MPRVVPPAVAKRPVRTARSTPAVPSAEERTAFRAAVADVHPLQWDRVHHEPPLPPAIPRQHLFDEAAALAESLHGPALIDLYLEGGDEAAWRRDGLPKAWLRDLRRGRWVTQGKLDLHGMNRDEARHAVVTFLRECRNRGHRCVRIVHGKGLRSGQRGPVIKQTVNALLRRVGAVIAFSSARQVDGGTGAVYVLLG